MENKRTLPYAVTLIIIQTDDDDDDENDDIFDFIVVKNMQPHPLIPILLRLFLLRRYLRFSFSIPRSVFIDTHIYYILYICIIS